MMVFNYLFESEGHTEYFMIARTKKQIVRNRKNKNPKCKVYTTSVNTGKYHSLSCVGIQKNFFCTKFQTKKKWF